jgi:hypothetical protein
MPPIPVGGPSLTLSRSDYGVEAECLGILSNDDGYYFDLGYDARILSPSGEVMATQSNGQYKPSIVGDLLGFDSTPEDGNYKCEFVWLVENWTSNPQIATIPIVVRYPASLSVIYDEYVVAQFNNYNRELHYQTKDQAGNNLSVINMLVDESYSTPSPNECNISVQTATARTTLQGQFRDNYVNSGLPACNLNSACISRTDQTIKVANFSVRTNEVTYACGSVAINPR